MSNDSGNKLSGMLGSVSEWERAKHPAGNRFSTVPPPPSFPPPPPNMLEQFFRPVANGLYFNGKLIHLDGYKFIGCRFDNCTLMVGTGNFELVNCIIDPSTVIQYGVQGLNVIRLFNAHNEWMHHNFPVFTPTKNADGSITISGGT